jgi:LuxR family transcriptional regulator, maltose regulon positive regulatory protein
MDTLLLATKLRIPPHPHQVVPRARLLDALEGGIPDCKLVQILAPAGYGKTTLLAQWAHASRFPIAWLSVGEEDNDLERFLRYLLTAWEQVQPGVQESPLGLLLGAMLPDSQAVLSAFINVANEVLDHVVFVLDDYHLIDDPSIHQALTFLLDHLPPTLHVVLAGRAAPPLPLARYRAKRELLELRTEDLQFLPEETADFLTQMMRLDLTHHEVETLHAQSEGWIAGLQLAALTLQRRAVAADKLVISGRHRFIADYLSEDVLSHLPDTMRRFLLQTSILDRLCGSLCDAVTGAAVLSARREETGGSQEMLERLERENVFLVPLDDSREWFRYHRLFADFLQGELHRRHSDHVADLHHRAAQWYLAHDLPEQAFRHAVARSDLELVIQIFERYFSAKLLGGEIRVVRDWLEALPDEWHTAHPMIGFVQASLLLFTGQFDACARRLDEVERLALEHSQDMRRYRAQVTALRCFIACFQNELAPAEALAQQALRELSEADLDLRRGIYGSLGDTYRRNGRWEQAKACYLKALDLPSASTSRVGSVHAFGALADLELRQGQLRDAAGYWHKALAVIQERETWGRFPLPLIGWVYIRMGEILYEWNELEAAGNHLSQGLSRAELGGDMRAMLAGYLIAGRLKLTAGDIAAAGEELERARPLMEKAPFPDWIGRFERLQVECWLAQNRIQAAVQWADELLRGHGREGHRESEETHLALAHVLIVKGDVPSLERALALLQRPIEASEAEGRVGVVIEATALQALAYWRRGEHTGALTSLERALRLAELHGYVRLFADLGLPMVGLLQEARSRDVMPDYVGKLLVAIGADLAVPASVEVSLLEPLSHREQEVLRLIAAGLTTREIGEKLVISPQTVKKHTGRIFSKLGVSNRTEAAAKARVLGLLDEPASSTVSPR